MLTFEDIMRKDPLKTRAIIEKNTKVNAYGETTISKDDPWFADDVWEKDYERVKRAESLL